MICPENNNQPSRPFSLSSSRHGKNVRQRQLSSPSLVVVTLLACCYWRRRHCCCWCSSAHSWPCLSTKKDNVLHRHCKPRRHTTSEMRAELFLFLLLFHLSRGMRTCQMTSSLGQLSSSSVAPLFAARAKRSGASTSK